MSDIEVMGDRGVVLPGHPPISAVLSVAGSKSLKAGTVLKTDGDAMVPAGAADTPSCVLVEDVDTTAGAKNARVLLHGMVVAARLRDYSAGSETAAGATLTAALRGAGIYAVQGWDNTNVL